MPSAHHIFNRQRVRAHRERASTRMASADFLFKEMAQNVCGRLSDINRSFPMALDLGAHTGIIAGSLNGRGGIKTLVQSDLSFTMLSHASGIRVVADEEFLPFAENTFDLVISAGSLHWVNDLPGTLVQIRHILKPDGLFIAAMPGGESLKELRHSLEQAELAVSGGLHPRISPYVDVRDAGSLLQRTGFVMPVVDSDTLTIAYGDPLKLLYDLRDMGETSAMLASAKGFTRRTIIYSAMDYYLNHYASEDGRVAATFEIVTLTGWKPKT